MSDEDKLWVITTESFETRNVNERVTEETKLNVNQLTTNVNIFLGQIDSLLNETPEKVGNFRFDELELYAEVSSNGELKMLGTGVGVGGMGGLKFVFRRMSS